MKQEPFTLANITFSCSRMGVKDSGRMTTEVEGPMVGTVVIQVRLRAESFWVETEVLMAEWRML